MSSTINVYLVSLDRLRQLFGSHDQATINAIIDGREDFLSEVDEIDEEAEMSCAGAVAELINGEVSEDGPGYLYGYALEAICSSIGRELPNLSGVAGASAWIEEVDTAMKAKGLPLRLSTLVYDGSPVPIPDPDDYPFIGHWSGDKTTVALKVFEALDTTGLDPEIGKTISQMHGWLKESARDPGAALIGFLS